jgi:ribosomal protein L11 methyltransferase
MAEMTASSEWLELSAAAEPEAVEAVAAVFAEHGQGVAIEQPVDSSRDGEVVTIPQDATVVVKTYVPLADPSAPQRQAAMEKGIWALGKLRQVGPLHVRHLREEDWANAWKDYFFVHRVGRRTVIVPSWRQAEYTPRADDIVLLLDPGMAFGTGLHPTTRLCLRAVEELVAPGMRVLDVGSGSGILAIAAARLGAACVTAFEIDPVAANVCRQNVERNQVGDLVTVQELQLESGSEARFDLVLANITFSVLSELHPTLARYLQPDGRAVLSGVLAERVDELVTLLESAGWQHEQTDQEQDWVALRLRRA